MPGYWKNHPEAFAGTGVTPTTTLVSVGFSVDAGLTFQEALELKGGDLNALPRHAAAAYLTAASPGVDYPLTTAQVVTETNAATPPATTRRRRTASTTSTTSTHRASATSPRPSSNALRAGAIRPAAFSVIRLRDGARSNIP
jgi:hypothetical protein